MNHQYIAILLLTLLIHGCVTKQDLSKQPTDLDFSIVEGCNKDENFSMNYTIEGNSLTALVRAPLTCGLKTINPNYSRWNGNDLITLSVNTYYDGGDLAGCYCWRTMKFKLPLEPEFFHETPKKLYFLQDKTVMGEIKIENK